VSGNCQGGGRLSVAALLVVVALSARVRSAVRHCRPPLAVALAFDPFSSPTMKDAPDTETGKDNHPLLVWQSYPRCAPTVCGFNALFQRAVDEKRRLATSRWLSGTTVA